MDINSYFKQANELYNIFQSDKTKIWYFVQHNSSKSSFEIYTKLCLVKSNRNDNVSVCKIEYRIGYSVSFSAPVLYLRAEDESGSSLDFNEFKNFLIDLNFDVDYLKYLIQVEHPYIGLPYFSMHPCKTNIAISELKRVVFIENSLKLWIQTFGNLFGLTISE